MESSSVLRALRLLAIALLTLVGAGVLTAGEAESSFASAVASATDAPAATRWASATIGSRALESGATDEVIRLDAIEIDLDDDDDVGSERQPLASGHTALAMRAHRSPQGARRASRAEPKPDPSRFAIGHGFARGPPA